MNDLLMIYLWGVLVAFALSTNKVLQYRELFKGCKFKTVLMGCLIYSLPSWLTVVRCLYYEFMNRR